MNTVTYVFPGQGTQRAGMIRAIGNSLEEIKDVFEMASDLSHKDVLNLCTNESDEELAKTENTQIAVTTMNLAFLTLLERRGIKPDIVMGQSLGQFSAVAAAGSMSIENTLRLIVRRAELMSKVTRKGVLCSILGLPSEVVLEGMKEVPESLGGLEVALINTDKQVVLGGDEKAIEKAAEIMTQRGAFKTVQIRVNQAFHTSFMKEIESDLADFVDSLPMTEPSCRMLLNCKGDYAENVDDIREDMKRATCHTVMWADSLTRMFDNPDLLVAEVGMGKTMAGLIRNMGYKSKIYLMSEPRDLFEFTKLAEKG